MKKQPAKKLSLGKIRIASLSNAKQNELKGSVTTQSMGHTCFCDSQANDCFSMGVSDCPV